MIANTIFAISITLWVLGIIMGKPFGNAQHLLCIPIIWVIFYKLLSINRKL